MVRVIPALSAFKFNSDINSDSFICNLHYKYIRNFFIVSFTFAITHQIFGDNIICHKPNANIDQHFLDSACLINGTFSKDKDGNIFHHNYYQWIPLLLVLESCSFYLPYRIWFAYFGFYLKKLQNVKNLESCIDLIESKHGDKFYWKTCFIEWVYLVHLIGQACIVNVFFNNGFSYPWNFKVFQTTFPNHGLCWVDYYASGFITTGRFLCLLPLNTFYRKLFVIISVAFWIIVLIHIFSFIFRIMYANKKTNINQTYSYKIAAKYAQELELQNLLKSKI